MAKQPEPFVLQARERIPSGPGRALWRLKNRVRGALSRMSGLRRRLTDIAGHEVVVGHGDAEREAELLDAGRTLSGAGARLLLGLDSECHENARSLYWSDPDRFTIWYGWALSDDGLWREHSWVMDGDLVVETTELRLLYFGVEERKSPWKPEPIRVVIRLSDPGEELDFERPWAEPLGEGRFRLINVPYFARCATFGDVFTIARDEDELLPHLDRVVERSGYRTIHIDTTRPIDLDQPMFADLRSKRCLTETSRSSDTERVRLAVCVPPSMDATEVERQLRMIV